MIAALALAVLASDLTVAGDAFAVAGPAQVELAGAPLGDPRPVASLAFDPTGRRLAETGGVAGESGVVRVWDVATRTVAWERALHADLVYDVVWSPDGGTLYTASADRRVGVLALDAGGAPAGGPTYLAGHSDQVLCLAVAPDGTLASGSLDRTIRLWRGGESVGVLDRHAGRVTSLAFSPDGARLASGGADRAVRIWQPAIGRMRSIVRDHEGVVLSLWWDAAGLASGCSDGAVRELDPLRARVDRVVRRHDDWVVAVARRGDALVSVDALGVVQGADAAAR